MRRMLSQVASLAWLPLGKPSPSVVQAFQKAMDQDAVFQMEENSGGNACRHVYFTPKSVGDQGLVLTAHEPFFKVAASWERQVRLFRFLIQVRPGKPLLQHEFQGKINRAESDKRTIGVALPKRIIALERRRNLRIRPKGVHVPHVAVWGIRKEPLEESGVRFNHHAILDAAPRGGEALRTILNLSAGGIRLAIDPHVYKRNHEWLEPNSRLIVQLMFEHLPGKLPTTHKFVAKVCNNRIDGVSRPEIGIRFLAARVQYPSPHWEPLGENNCERLAMVIFTLEAALLRQSKA